MVLYRNSEPAKQVLDTTELDPTVDLYPAITFLDDDATKLQTIVCAFDPFETPSVNSLTSASSSISSYFPLPDGNPWNRLSGGTVYYENFYSDNVGEIATYRRLTSGGNTQYWQLLSIQ